MKTYVSVYVCAFCLLFLLSVAVGALITNARADSSLADESPLVAASMGEPGYTQISLTPVFTSGISVPKLISTNLTVDYQVQPETSYNLVRRQTTVTQVYEELIRVAPIQ